MSLKIVKNRILLRVPGHLCWLFNIYDIVMEVTTMETKNVILKLRTERGMSQDELADKVMITRQAVSRWENGV